MKTIKKLAKYLYQKAEETGFDSFNMDSTLDDPEYGHYSSVVENAFNALILILGIEEYISLDDGLISTVEFKEIGNEKFLEIPLDYSRFYIDKNGNIGDLDIS